MNEQKNLNLINPKESKHEWDKTSEQDKLLLTPEEIRDIAGILDDNFPYIGGKDKRTLAIRQLDELFESKLAKAKQHYEQKKGELFKEIEDACGKCPDEPFGKLPASMFWQSLKDKYLGGMK